MIGSLFSGIGGLELGLEWAGLGPTVFQVEQDPYCRRVLARHWPDAVRFDDVRTVSGATLPAVDLLCGGFPCQDISSANHDGKGLDGARSGLWFEHLRIIEETRPAVVVIENVSRLVRRGLDVVVAGLDGLGFEVEGTRLRARDVGAPHERERLFLVAYADRADRDRLHVGERAGRVAPVAAGGGAGEGTGVADSAVLGWPGAEDIGDAGGWAVPVGGGEALADALRGDERHEPGWRVGSGRAGPTGPTHGGTVGVGLADSNRARGLQPEGPLSEQRGRARDGSGGVADTVREGRDAWRWRSGWGQSGAPALGESGRPAEPRVGRDVAGLPDRLDATQWPAGRGPYQHPWEPPRLVEPRSLADRSARVKALGNAVVPQCAYVVGCRIRQRLGMGPP